MGFTRGEFNRDFSRAMGKRGWIGMTWPKQYGGHERIVLRTLRGDRGNAGRRRAAVRALHRRPAERPEHLAFRHRGTEAVLLSEDRRRRTDLLHRHERTELRLRPRRHAHPRGEGRWRLQDQRQQAVDLQRASRRLRHPVLQDGAGGQGGPGPSRRRNAVPAASEVARHRHPPGAQLAGRAPLQRNLPDRRVRSRHGCCSARKATAGTRSPASWRSNAVRRTASWCCSRCCARWCAWPADTRTGHRGGARQAGRAACHAAQHVAVDRRHAAGGFAAEQRIRRS